MLNLKKQTNNEIIKYLEFRVNLATTNDFWHLSVHDQSYSGKLFVAANK